MNQPQASGLSKRSEYFYLDPHLAPERLIHDRYLGIQPRQAGFQAGTLYASTASTFMSC